MSKKTGVCHWCGEDIVDGGEEAGAPPGVVDWMIDGDYESATRCDSMGSPIVKLWAPSAEYWRSHYGCSDNPINDEEGTGSHQTLADVRDMAREHLVLWEALQDLVRRCDGEEGVREDGSNIDTSRAHAALGDFATREDV